VHTREGADILEVGAEPHPDAEACLSSIGKFDLLQAACMTDTPSDSEYSICAYAGLLHQTVCPVEHQDNLYETENDGR